MQRLIRTLRSLVPGQEQDAREFPFNRIAQAHSHDRALAAFKAEQLAVARRNRTAARPEAKLSH
jgi:hypothetical protein